MGAWMDCCATGSSDGSKESGYLLWELTRYLEVPTILLVVR